jgi:hypothetical protein
MENKNQTSRGDAQDRTKIAGDQEHEVNYQKEKMDSGEEEKKAVKPEGHSRQKLERKFRNRPLL